MMLSQAMQLILQWAVKADDDDDRLIITLHPYSQIATGTLSQATESDSKSSTHQGPRSWTRLRSVAAHIAPSGDSPFQVGTLPNKPTTVAARVS
jgi:hypothetical protein